MASGVLLYVFSHGFSSVSQDYLSSVWITVFNLNTVSVFLHNRFTIVRSDLIHNPGTFELSPLNLFSSNNLPSSRSVYSLLFCLPAETIDSKKWASLQTRSLSPFVEMVDAVRSIAQDQGSSQLTPGDG